MTTGFTKLFSSIVTSTIWQEPNETRIVWITMLAVADRAGEVMASLPGLASIAHVSREAAERAIATLSAPDPYSRTTEFEGRRIEPIDGGWRLLNHAKYRAAFSQDERREYKKLKQRQYRHPEFVHNSPRGQMRTNVDTMQRQSTERKKETKKEMSTLSTRSEPNGTLDSVNTEANAEAVAENSARPTEQERTAAHKKFACQLRELSAKLRSPTAPKDEENQ